MRRPLKEHEDAFGHALMDHLRGRGGVEIIERDDGHIDVSAGAGVYFAPPHGLQREIVERAAGRVLDIGCGAGRYALYLQERGYDIMGIDVSPLGLAVCRERGLRAVRLLSLAQVDASLGNVDTMLMLGNNFGLFGSFGGAQRLLRRLRALVNSGGRIIAETLDPYQTSDPFHHAYHARNRERGRMAGQVRLRVRYRTFRTPWFDYLFVSRPELESIVAGTGWHIEEIMRAEERPGYVAVLQRTA